MAHWKAKLSDEQVVAIRAARESGRTLSNIAGEYGISQAHVSRLALGQSRAST
jgi:DNA-directed RNA polymerase specialized sigma subunit